MSERPRESTVERRRLENAPARGLTLSSVIAVLLAFVAVPTFGAGAVLALVNLAVAWRFAQRGYVVTGPRRAAIAALVISGVSMGACWRFFPPEVEVTGREERHQDRVEDKFDRAFETATAAPGTAPLDQKPAIAHDAGPGSSATE